MLNRKEMNKLYILSFVRIQVLSGYVGHQSRQQGTCYYMNKASKNLSEKI